MGNFEFDIDMKPGTWIYISRFDERNLKLMILFLRFISNTPESRKRIFCSGWLINFIEFFCIYFFEYQKNGFVRNF